jgi:hypothetical protein
MINIDMIFLSNLVVRHSVQIFEKLLMSKW